MSKYPKDDANKNKKKGFYVALYSSIGVILAVAAIVSFNNFNGIQEPEPQQLAAGQTQSPALELAPVGLDSYLGLDAYQAQSSFPSYLTPSDRAEAEQGEYTLDEGELAHNEEEDEDITQVEVTPDSPMITVEENRGADENQASVSTDSQSATESAAATEGQAEPGTALVQEPSNDEAMETIADSVFAGYTGEEKMVWPVLGEIVMDYSTDRTLYDRTLDQYRTNDSIAIKSEVGSQVKASAEGVVSSVTKTREDGITIVVDNGNGWSTTYSQLQDGVLVKVGDYVKPGQVIGGVGEPSIYSVLLGSHLDFKVTKDEQTIDPKSLLE